MPKKPTDTDRLAVTTAQRLDRHIARSAERHRDSSARIKELRLLVLDLYRKLHERGVIDDVGHT